MLWLAQHEGMAPQETFWAAEHAIPLTSREINRKRVCAHLWLQLIALTNPSSLITSTRFLALSLLSVALCTHVSSWLLISLLLYQDYGGITASCSFAYLLLRLLLLFSLETALHFSPLILFLCYCQVILNSTAFMPVPRYVSLSLTLWLLVSKVLSLLHRLRGAERHRSSLRRSIGFSEK